MPKSRHRVRNVSVVVMVLILASAGIYFLNQNNDFVASISQQTPEGCIYEKFTSVEGTDISCTDISACANYVQSLGATQEMIDQAQFRCSSNKCEVLSCESSI